MLKNFELAFFSCLLFLTTSCFGDLLNGLVPGKDYVPGEIIVKVRDASDTTINIMSRNLLFTSEGQVREIKGTPFIKVKIDEFAKPLLNARFQPVTMKSLMRELSRNSEIEYVEPNYIWRAFDTVPNDTYFSKQWNFQDSRKGIDIDAVKAWDVFKGDENFIVAVIDTGVDYSHPDLKANAWINEGETGKDEEGNDKATNKKDDDGNGYVDDVYGWDFNADKNDPKDDHGHGTHCAGVIGADSDNDKGVAGINWKVKIMALKFLSKSGSGSTEGAIKAIQYGIDNGARVLSNSWGGGPYSRALKDVIKAANEKGVLFIAAAGNSSSNNDTKATYPANYDIENVVSVASTTSSDSLSYFSNYGKQTVHLAAPGSSIYSTVINGKYKSMSGTSMACPHVSGAVALLWGYKPEMTMGEIKARLLATVEEVPSLRNKVATKGRLNIYNLLMDIQPEPEPDLDWKEVEKKIESEHPYPVQTTKTWVIKHDGAKHLRVHFERLETERKYDQIFILDKDKKVIESFSGSYAGFWTDKVPGDEITIKLVSDFSVTKFGFIIDKYAWSEE